MLPVWFLLVPRDYLSTYLKIGTILMLAVGIIFVQPTLLITITPFINGGGPVIGGPALPFIFITIASCGAMSGFHAIIGTRINAQIDRQ